MTDVSLLHIHPSLQTTSVSGIRQMAQRVAERQQAHPERPTYALTLGLPHCNTPRHIVEAAVDAARAGYTQYTPNAGLPVLREAVATYMRTQYDLDYNGQREVLVTNGATQAIDIALRTVLTPGCDVIVPTPIYPGYDPLIRLCGARPVYIDTTSHGYKLTASALEAYITPNTRCVILTSPSNPTGIAYDDCDIEALSDLLSRHNLWIVSDEIYSELTYDGTRHVSIASHPALRSQTIVINGLSKSHAMTGWRIGFVLAEAHIVAEMTKVLQYSSTCACSISQYAALAAVTTTSDDVQAMRVLYEKNRDLLYKRLVTLGIPVVKPQGAFYLFPDIRQFGWDSTTFAYQLLEEQDVAVIPGVAFGTAGEGYLRLSYACSTEYLLEAINRMTEFMTSRF